MIDLKDSIIIVAVLFSSLIAFFAVAHFISNKVISRKRAQEVCVPKVTLSQVLEFKIQMQDEQTRNHELDQTKGYNTKISEGTKSLNDFKVSTNTTICENYRMG